MLKHVIGTCLWCSLSCFEWYVSSNHLKWIVVIGNPNTNEANDQIENKKTTTNKKTLQTQQCKK